MQAKHAAILLSQAIVVFQKATPGEDKRRMADAVVALREVIPKVLATAEDMGHFLNFVANFNADVSAAAAYSMSVSVQTQKSRCLNNGTDINCKGPPASQSYCDLCKRRGKV